MVFIQQDKSLQKILQSGWVTLSEVKTLTQDKQYVYDITKWCICNDIKSFVYNQGGINTNRCTFRIFQIDINVWNHKVFSILTNAVMHPPSIIQIEKSQEIPLISLVKKGYPIGRIFSFVPILYNSSSHCAIYWPSVIYWFSGLKSILVNKLVIQLVLYFFHNLNYIFIIQNMIFAHFLRLMFHRWSPY